MIKAYLLSVLLYLFVGQVVMADDVFAADKIEKYHHIKKLDLSTMLTTFYPNQQQNFHLNAQSIGELNGMPYAGLRQQIFPIGNHDYQTVAIMHPVQTYKNAQQQTRYLVLIEKCLSNKQGELLSGVSIAYAEGDLYVFKKINHGYQLVARSADDTEFDFAYGRLLLDLPQLAKSLKPVGGHVQAKIEGYQARQKITRILTIKEGQHIVLK